MKTFIIPLLACLLLLGCSDEKRGPIEGGGAPPKPVTNLKVENLHGTAKITYSIPDNPDLLYIKAVYEPRKGLIREAKSSFYINYIVLEGFSASEEYEVKLYAVNKSEVSSEPVSIKVNPLTPPVEEVFNSLEVAPDFGGCNIKFLNNDETNIVIGVITLDSTGDWVSSDNFYTKRKSASFAVRGYKAEERTFGIFIKDKWNNFSDTLITKLVPIHEELLDKTKFRDARFPSEPKNYSSSWTIQMFWDDNLTKGFHTLQNVGLPLNFTMDLGVKAKMSRFKIWQRTGTYLYGHGNPRRWELWGSDAPSTDGSMTNWTMIGSFESIKPSGEPYISTQEDKEYAEAGEEFIVPLNAGSYRYLRWRVREAWGAAEGSPGGFFHLMEVTIWGNSR
ncbi:DUF5000 domain-containing lipoprotein [Chitinophaga niabensis]|uniref:DUF5000 domain-containing lipoprotein n=1 Tax=Chitinophaga niabensis TaxID=536979 RepID=UPI0031BAE63E